MIATGEITIEVRKSRPKLNAPFKVYIYCTNRRPYLVWGDVFRGDWETEFTDLHGYSRDEAEKIWDVFNGHIIGEFVCNWTLPLYIEYSDTNSVVAENVFPGTGMTDKEMIDYLGNGKFGYAWNISNLEIYDTPKDISEFRKVCGTQNCDICQFWENTGEYVGCLTREERRLRCPPQSWCYVEEFSMKRIGISSAGCGKSSQELKKIIEMAMEANKS